jgi:hypothetical protein
MEVILNLKDTLGGRQTTGLRIHLKMHLIIGEVLSKKS